MYSQAYFAARSVGEALAYLRENDGQARVIAGGTDLVLQLRNREKCARALVYITPIRELRYVEKDGDLIRIGALTTHDELASSVLLREKARALAQAAQAVGSPHIRLVGTIGGNIVNAQPAADAVIALVALRAKVRIATPEGEKVQEIDDLFSGVGACRVDPTREILTEVFFRIPHGSGFRRLARRRVLSLPILNAAAATTLGYDTLCQDVGLAIGPVAPVPFRPRRAEALLRGSKLDAGLVKQAAEMAMIEANPRDSIRGRSEFRREMIKVLVERALLDAIPDAP